MKKRKGIYALEIYTNAKIRGRAIAHYCPSKNIIESRIDIVENSPFGLSLLAHEFAHALTKSSDIVGNRSGHGVFYYLRMVRDVIWHSQNIPMADKLRAIKDEFEYSCCLGQYRVHNRIFRSQSTVIALPLKYFTFKTFESDSRKDINELGRWMHHILSPYIKDLENTKYDDMDLESIIDIAIKNIEGSKYAIPQKQN